MQKQIYWNGILDGNLEEMNKIAAILVFVCLSSLFFACEDVLECFTSSGNVILEEREISGFTKINLTDNVDLLIEYGSDNKIYVEAGENLIDNIKTSVKDGMLYIKNENSCNWARSFKNEFKVMLTLDTLSLIAYSGVGNIDFINIFEVDTFRMEIYDAWGSVNLNYQGDYLRVIHNIGGVDFTNCF